MKRVIINIPLRENWSNEMQEVFWQYNTKTNMYFENESYMRGILRVIL